MQEGSQLVLGIDLCDDITQVTVMRPYSAEPEAVAFDALTRREFLPTVLVSLGDTWKLEESTETEGKRASAFFHAAMLGRETAGGKDEPNARELTELFLKLLLKRIEERFYSQEIGLIAVTCEEADNEASAEFLRNLFLGLGWKEDRVLILSHLTAFLNYSLRQEEGLWKKGAAAFDYTTGGLRFYSMECYMRGGERLLLSDLRDYSDTMPADYIKTETTERAALTFERLAGKELQGKTATLYITGRGFEGEWTSEVLRMLSVGRRVFRGQNLYTQGACYKAADIFFRNQKAPFSVFWPDQITYDVFLQAETTDEQELCLAHAGETFGQIHSEVTVLLDTVDRLTFRVTKVATDREYQLRIAPGDLTVRADRTSRYAVRVFFVTKTQMVIQLKDLGFGDFYPSTGRLYEEIIDLAQLEQ